MSIKNQIGKKSTIVLFTAIMFFIVPMLAFGQGNAFSFQGRLNDGANPANGRYDLQFKLFDAAIGGTQIGPTVERPNTVLINGVFSTTLDFGAAAFQNPNSIFIEIAVKPNGSPNVLTILGPRQQLTVVPYASRAQNATVADNSTNLGGIAAGEYITRTGGGADFIRNSTQTQTNSNFNISGTGIINGNLSVGGNLSLVGNQTVVGNSNLGAVRASGNLTQPTGLFGVPKAMIFVGLNGEIIRCYNGTTGAITANCGFTSTRVLQGEYDLDFGFNISNSFFVITTQRGGNLSRIGTNFALFSSSQPTKLRVACFFINVINDLNSSADNPFMIVVY